MHALIVSMMDPRGRCDRRGLLLAALVMLGVEVAMLLGLWATGGSLSHPVLFPIKAGLIYLAISAAIQRLHDLGHSGWALLWAAIGLMAWAAVLAIGAISQLPPERLVPGEIGHVIVFGGTLVPLLAGLLWLHFSPGQAGSNDYGPAPGSFGFARAVDGTAATPTSTASAAA